MTAFLGEIRLFAGNFAPMGWAFCDGSLLSISQNTALFSLIGTTYGGDGISTFGLPDLRSRVPIHAGPGYPLGQSGGVEAVTLTTAQLPAHTHLPRVSSAAGTQTSPAGNVWASGSGFPYAAPSVAPNVTLDPAAVQPSGGGQPHDNMVPFLAINFIIAMNGIFPSST